MSSDRDTVPGLGFKDKEKALETIKNLEGRDADYQKLAVKGLIGRAKRTLQVTKADDKVNNIKEALTVFEKWLKNFEKLRVPNWSYLPLDTVESFVSLQKHFRIEKADVTAFQDAFKGVDGDYKKLRTVSSGDEKPTWDIARNKELKELITKYEENDIELWDDELPTKLHTEMIMWAYSPDASKIKKSLSSIQSKLEKFNIDDDGKDDDTDQTSEEKTDNGDAQKCTKRKSNSNLSDASDEESSEKKTRD